MRIWHGGALRQFSEKYGIPEREVLDFSSNINPLGPPPLVLEALDQIARELPHYPDPEAREFRGEVARHFPLWPENVIAGNGAAELLDLIVRFLRPRRALLIEPAFLEYRRLMQLAGAEIRSLSLKEKDSFLFTHGEILNALSGVEVVILGHPNNPTGTAMERADLTDFMKEAKRRDIFVILDEAFVDWVPELSLGSEVRDDSYFFIIRSLTKFFALPGIRIGYGLGSRKLIEKLSGLQVPWSCNRVAQRLGILALRDDAFMETSRQWLIQEKEKLVFELGKIPWLKVYPGLANFLLLRFSGPPAGSSLIEEMGHQGIYVRGLAEFPGLGPFYFRIAVRTAGENQKLIAFLKSRKVELVES